MAEPIKSALFVDYENLQRSLSGGDGRGDTRLADRAAAWVAAIETGRLIGPEGFRRKFVAKRCYAGPSVRGKQRDALASAGFDVIDVGANDGARSSGDLHMAMDTIDALGKPNGPEEFILLSGASELTPLLTRLKASKRNTVIFASETVPDGDKALADAFLDRTAFADFLASGENPAAAPAKNTAASATDRADIEAFARKIHAATNIPLFSPKTFAELFRHLTDEISENGYHFQTTAKNVADRMTANGRSVTRRQVVFIVKGLALKGHVFSTTDTPERLAEVFREQAAYLISNAGVALDEQQDRLLSAWFMSKPAVPPQAGVAPEKMPAAISEPPHRQPVPEASEPQQRPPEKAKQPPAGRPTASAKPPPVRPVDLPKSAAPPPPPTQKPIPQPDAREEAKAVIAARIAASAKMKSGSRTPAPTNAAPKPAAKPAPAASAAQARPQPPAMTPRGPQQVGQQRSPDGLEDSILAAIAEAVDVLVENGSQEEPTQEPPTRKKPPVATRPSEPPAQSDAEDAESGDIGDQIQRIIASYNRNRSEE